MSTWTFFASSQNVTAIDNSCSTSGNLSLMLLVITNMCIIIGLVYTFLGYRLFKAVLFLTGFKLTSAVVYLICMSSPLPPVGNIGIALASGVLMGTVTMLVEYVGLFLTGFLAGLPAGGALMVLISLIHSPYSEWLPVLVIFLSGTALALLILKFQTVLLLLSTAFIGGAIVFVSLDSLTSYFSTTRFVLAAIFGSQNLRAPNCWYAWLWTVWPVLFLAGTIIQWKFTAAGFSHREPFHPGRRKDKPVTAKPDAKNTAGVNKHLSYRHLYKARRMKGDVVCQETVSLQTSTS